MAARDCLAPGDVGAAMRDDGWRESFSAAGRVHPGCFLGAATFRRCRGASRRWFVWLAGRVSGNEMACWWGGLLRDAGAAGGWGGRWECGSACGRD